jgi:cell division septal protein FtsQ
VQRRLEEVQRTRGTRSSPASLRGPLQGPTPVRSRGGRAAIFVAALLAGTFLAQAVTATVASWWNERPVVLTVIAVQGTERLTSEDVAFATGLEKGGPLDALSLAQLQTQVAAHPWIQNARVALLPTGTLIVEVEERVPQAVLRSSSGDHFVDASGVVFARVEPEDAGGAAALPLLVGEADDSAALRAGLAIAEHLVPMALPGLEESGAAHRALALQLPSGTAANPREGWVLRGTGRTKVVLGSDDVATVHDRLDRLARLLEADLGELEETETIDLRFAGQAVLRKTSTSR